MTHSNEALSRLRGITLEDLTTEQMSSVLGPSSISPSVISQFEQATLLSAAQSAQKTFPWGHPIPEKSAIVGSALAAGESYILQPEGTEIFHVTGIEILAAAGTPTINIHNFNGSATCLIHSGTSSTTGSSFFPWESSYPLTNTGYLRVDNTDLSNAVTVTVAYHVVSL